MSPKKDRQLNYAAKYIKYDKPFHGSALRDFTNSLEKHCGAS